MENPSMLTPLRRNNLASNSRGGKGAQNVDFSPIAA